MSETLLHTADVSHMTGLAESVRHFTYNAVTQAADSHCLFQAGVRVAKELGYDDVPEGNGLYGVEIASGPNYGQLYIPGTVEYSPEDHVRGVTATIADSRLSPIVKSFLISKAVDATAMTRPSKLQQFVGGEQAEDNVGVSERAAKQAALSELGAIRVRTGVTGVEYIAQELAAVSNLLEDKWHPHREKVTLAALGLGVAGLFAVLRSKRHQ